jgi:DNA phosphorothioation-dependent restriction protein DptG
LPVVYTTLLLRNLKYQSKFKIKIGGFIRAKNKRGVNSLRDSDKKFLNMLERVGYVSHSAALELGVTERRLDAYQTSS